MGNESDVVEICKNGVEVAISLYYRCVQFLHVIFSVSAIVLIVWTVMKYREVLIFHNNVKVLLYSLYISCLLHAMLMTICQCYQLYLGYSYREPCDVSLHHVFYTIAHTLYAFSLAWMENILIMMIFERSIAIFYVGQYEKFRTNMGNLLLFLTVVMCVCEYFWAYRSSDFNTPHYSFMELPLNQEHKIVTLLRVMFAAHIVGSVMIVFIYIAHCRRYRRRLAQSLSARFQAYETKTSSHLLFALSALEIIALSIHYIASIYLRNAFDSQAISPSAAVSTAIVLYPISEYTLLFPLVTIFFLTKAKRARRSNIISMTQMKASGAEGWAIYSCQLQKQWK